MKPETGVNATTTGSLGVAAYARDVSSGRGLFGAILRWLQKLRAERALAAAAAELNSLDDYLLKDLGITRSEIGSVLTDTTGERRNGARVPWPPGRR